MKALVTGGLGFIGSAVAKRLMEADIEVRIVDKAFDGTDIRVADLSQYEDVAVVFHFAGPCSVKQFNLDPEGCMDTTVMGLRNVIRLVKKSGARLVFPSSGSVYGAAPNVEETRPHPVNLYGLAKLRCEKMLADSGIENYVALRIFAGYGPGEARKGELSSFVFHVYKSAKRGIPPTVYGDGTQTRDFVFVDDVVTCAIKALYSDPKERIVNVGTGKSFSFNQVVAIGRDYYGGLSARFVGQARLLS